MGLSLKLHLSSYVIRNTLDFSITTNVIVLFQSHIPIVFHNLSGYNVHLLIRVLGKKFDKGKISVIAENKEKYISFNVDVVVGEYV